MQDRDASVERLLRQALRDDARPVGVCLDADTIAAWSEGGLSGQGLAAAEAHAASCVRCQAALAAMVRTAHVADGVDTRDAHASSPSSLARGVRWLVPIAGAAAAAALVLAIWPGARVRDLAPVPEPVNPPKESAEPAPETAQSSPADKPDAQAKSAPVETVSSSLSAAKTRERQEAADEKAKNEEKEKAADAERRAKFADVGRADSALREQPARDGLVTQPPAKPQPTPRPVSSPRQTDQLQKQTQDFRQNQAPSANQASNANQTQAANQNANQAQAPAQTQNAPQSQAQGRQATPPPAGAPAGLPAAPPPPAAGVVAGQAGSRAAAVDRQESVLLRTGIEGAIPSLIATPESSVVWRILNGRDIQRSQDAGITWTTQTTVPDVRLAAGACPSVNVCWIVGSGGSVLRTTDGRSWQRIQFPEATDLVVITASNPETVVVTTKDGRRFSTRDAGKTWAPEM